GLNFLALEQRDLHARTFCARRANGFDFRFARGFSIGPAAFAFFVNIGWEETRLPQLADRLAGRPGFDQSGGLLSTCIKSYVSEARHGRYAKAPNPKFQVPKKLQIPSSKRQSSALVWDLELGNSLE